MPDTILHVYRAEYVTSDDGIRLSPLEIVAPSLLEAVVLSLHRVETLTGGYYELTSVQKLRSATKKERSALLAGV